MSTDDRGKWLADSTLGPIMRKKVEKAISDLSWEGKSFFTAYKGFYGDPVDPEDLRTHTTEIFMSRDKGPLRTDEADSEIREAFDYVLTAKNYKAVITVYEEATRKAVESRPIRDERRTPEADAEVKDLVAEREALNRVVQAEHDALNAKLEAVTPAGATRVIVASLKEDRSDPMSDYSSNTAVRTVAIGFGTNKREDFKLLHRAAASFPETAHLGSQEALTSYLKERDNRSYSDYIAENAGEHRDNYSMGAGNYLSDHGWDGGGSGWVIKSYTLPVSYLRLTEIALPGEVRVTSREALLQAAGVDA